MGCELNSSGSSDPSKSLCYTVGSQVTALDGRAVKQSLGQPGAAPDVTHPTAGVGIALG